MTLSYFEQRALDGGGRFSVAIQTLRPAIAQLLEHVRDGFFRTYTDHSIRHCSEMFTILEWLIPHTVKNQLTDAECSLLVVAVYLHDLGMVVSSAEFDSRENNADFLAFRERYIQTVDFTGGQDADHPTREHFLFEEYIRATHAARIATWINGSPSNVPQAAELRGMLHGASESFRHYLGVICRSHHLDNLYDRSQYPVDLKLGNSEADTANIQFLAILLRLADLLHMSRDRAPSIHFSLISPRNPVSAREWAKQLAVTGVGLSAGDPAEILVHAVCKDPRQYFYLKDFISQCDAELSKCRDWLESTPPTLSPRYFLAVRRVSDSGLKAEGFIAERFELELDHKRVVELLMGHSLYGDAKVAIRELLQNAIDAVRVRRLDDQQAEPTIHITYYPDRRELSIVDSGIGMDLAIIRNHFLKIGDSFYRSPAFRQRYPGYAPISQFGIGFLSAFMIADRVTVTTRAVGQSTTPLFLELEDIYDLFTVRELVPTSAEAQMVRAGGTAISLRLREGIELENLAQEVGRWIVFLEFPVRVQVGSSAPLQVTGIVGSTPQEIADDILRLQNEPASAYVPILLERDDVHFVVLWPGGHLGTIPVIDPAGIYILPFTERVKRWYEEDRARKFEGRRRPDPIQKVANAGVFLASEIPGFKFSGNLRVHYIVNCRGRTRFTPLVSRNGIAVDGHCAKIVDSFVRALLSFLDANVKQLHESGISKYFCSYYASAALAHLFNRRAIESEEERVLSVILALRHARTLPFVLLKADGDLLLTSFERHGQRPIVLGRNAYNDLLRSVAFGLAEIPLPQAVLDSLPEGFVLSMGAEDVLYPLIVLSGYHPVRVTYDESAKGVFVHCEPGSAPPYFGRHALLDFPHELRDVSAIHFNMVKCLNSRSQTVTAMRAFADAIAMASPAIDRQDLEENCCGVFLEGSRGFPSRDKEELRRHVRSRLEHLAQGHTPVSDSLVALPEGVSTITDELWAYRL